MAAAPQRTSFSASSKRTQLDTQKVDGERVVPLERLFTENVNFRHAFGLNAKRPFGRGASSDEEAAPVAKPQMLQSSAAQQGAATVGARWGLCSTIVDAYNQHHELVLKPDDVWQAIMTQFSFYVNANGEALRDRFVDFQGKKTLVVDMGGGSIHTCDYAEFAQRMVDENIVKNIKDPCVVEWLLPAFSTTTVHDRVVAAVSIMATLQSYFEYVCCLKCGIPQVTLLGTVQDWQTLRRKVDKLLDYDLQDERMSAWHKLLVPVLDNFVSSVMGQVDLEFWDVVCSHHGGGSGPSYLSGWVTVFAAFNKDGKWQGSVREGYKWPMIDTNHLPAGTFAVPVLVDDNGTQYDTQMIAGQLASEICCEGKGLCPRSDWCIAYTGSPRTDPVAYKHESHS
mmetsp:Transcript_62995/g.117148  ORF Transcript_62995/g.117148 Transcript_62995/m.117148 type:complete len:395 (-) Transcript_62995:145-1329(-)